jgi:hypothetical protein
MVVRVNCLHAALRAIGAHIVFARRANFPPFSSLFENFLVSKRPYAAAHEHSPLPHSSRAREQRFLPLGFFPLQTGLAVSSTVCVVDSPCVRVARGTPAVMHDSQVELPAGAPLAWALLGFKRWPAFPESHGTQRKPTTNQLAPASTFQLVAP